MSIYCLLHILYWGLNPANRACALDPESNQQPPTAWVDAQPAEPQQPGQNIILFIFDSDLLQSFFIFKIYFSFSGVQLI